VTEPDPAVTVALITLEAFCPLLNGFGSQVLPSGLKRKRLGNTQLIDTIEALVSDSRTRSSEEGDPEPTFTSEKTKVRGSPPWAELTPPAVLPVRLNPCAVLPGSCGAAEVTTVAPANASAATLATLTTNTKRRITKAPQQRFVTAPDHTLLDRRPLSVLTATPMVEATTYSALRQRPFGH